MAAQGSSRKEQLQYELQEYKKHYDELTDLIRRREEWLWLYSESASKKVVQEKRESLEELKHQKEETNRARVGNFQKGLVTYYL